MKPLLFLLWLLAILEANSYAYTCHKHGNATSKVNKAKLIALHNNVNGCDDQIVDEGDCPQDTQKAV